MVPTFLTMFHIIIDRLNRFQFRYDSNEAVFGLCNIHYNFQLDQSHFFYVLLFEWQPYSQTRKKWFFHIACVRLWIFQTVHLLSHNERWSRTNSAKIDPDNTKYQWKNANYFLPIFRKSQTKARNKHTLIERTEWIKITKNIQYKFISWYVFFFSLTIIML